MKQWISLFFILALCGTLLPGVLSYDQKKVVLFSTVEEEQPEHGKEVKAKDDLKVLCVHEFSAPQTHWVTFTYPNLSILFSDDPISGIPTPPPDSFC